MGSSESRAESSLLTTETSLLNTTLWVLLPQRSAPRWLVRVLPWRVYAALALPCHKKPKPPGFQKHCGAALDRTISLVVSPEGEGISLVTLKHPLSYKGPAPAAQSFFHLISSVRGLCMTLHIFRTFHHRRQIQSHRFPFALLLHDIKESTHPGR